MLDKNFKDAERDIMSGGHYGYYSEERHKINEIIWEFILERVLAPGGDILNQNLPFIHLTEYGRTVVQHREIQPHDPDGYLSQLTKDIPNIDSEIIEYVTESLHGYQRGLMLSSAVMLGGASEKAFILLLEELTNALTDPARRKRFTKLQQEMGTKSRFNKVKQELLTNRSKMPPDVKENLGTYLDGIFNVIRVTRNEAGHPTGKTPKRDITFVNLRLFLPYKKIYQLIDWLQKNQI